MNEFLRELLMLPPQASTFSKRVDTLHFIVIGITFFAAFVIFGAAFWWIVKYRRRSNDPTPNVQPKLWMEALYVGIPLVVFVALFFLGYHDYVWVRTPPADAMDVYVTAKQWMWKFTYPQGPSSIGVLYVPAGRPVRVLITSRDVVHSFYVPAFRIKMDAVPGRYTETWFQVTQPGRYLVMCTQYCGLNHSRMRAVVVALAPAQFDDWLNAQRKGLEERRDASSPGPEVAQSSAEPGKVPTPKSPLEPDSQTLPELAPPVSDLAAQGQRVAAEQGCLNCHTVNGEPHIGPTWLDLYLRKEKLETGEEVVADEPYLTKSMMQPLADIVAGFQPVMPSYQGRLGPTEIAALLEYIKSLRSDRATGTKSKEPDYEQRPVP